MRTSIQPDTFRMLSIQLHQSVEQIRQITELIDTHMGSLDYLPIMTEESIREWELAKQESEMIHSLLADLEKKLIAKGDWLTYVETYPYEYPHIAPAFTEQAVAVKHSHILSGYGREYKVSSNPHSVMALMAGQQGEQISRTRHNLHHTGIQLEGWTFIEPRFE